MKSVFIAGCGDIGQRVAHLCLAQGRCVRGLARSEQNATRLQAEGIEPVRGDLEQPQTLVDLPTADAVTFYFAAPPSQGESDPLLGNFLAALDTSAPAAKPAKLILISTTAVYGDCQGAWVTEQQALQPQTSRGRRRLDAEQRLQAWASKNAVPFVILRVAGIYGPGRLPVARLEAGAPILAPGESPFSNRIHQDDLAQVCVAAAEKARSGEVYNVSDGKPGTMSQYFMDIATALDLPPPPVVSRAQAEQVMSAGMLSYLQESRRLDNQKMREELGVSLRYPDLAAGLAALK